MNIKKYESAINFMKSRENYGIKPGLDRMKKMLVDMKYENKCKIIHVTGTNGKGSTTAYIEAGLLTTGKKIGTFTSPSLSGLTGYFTLNNNQMGKWEFVTYLNQLLPSIKKLDQDNNYPSEFEILTMIAILYFENHADFAVIETGMGGMYDTTNVLLPIVSVITSISIDHQAFLGDTLKEISEHKAGIIKEGIPVVLGKVQKVSLDVVRRVANKKSGKLYILGEEFNVNTKKDNYVFYQHGKANSYQFTLKNKGVYQSENASLAIQVFLILKDFDIEINLIECIDSIEKTLISNRFEEISENPRIIIDGAHNEASMKAFLKTVELDEAKNKHLIISAFKDKPLKKMLTLAKNHFQTITLTTFEHNRAYSPKELKNINLDILIESDWHKCINAIKKNNNSTYYIVGSVFFTSIVKNTVIKK